MKNALGCIIRILIIVIILLAILGLFVYFVGGGSCIRKIDRTLPAVEIAQWEVTTPMQLYYAEDVDVIKDNGIKSVTMSGWYEKVEGRWIRRDDSVTLERDIYGRIEVRRRE